MLPAARIAPASFPRSKSEKRNNGAKRFASFFFTKPGFCVIIDKSRLGVFGLKMNESYEETVSAPQEKNLHIALKILIGLGLGLAASGLGILIPIVGLLNLVCIFLPTAIGMIAYGLCDIPGYAAFLLSYEAAICYVGGPKFAVAAMLAIAIPGAFFVRTEIKREGFSAQLYKTIAVQLLGLVAALGFFTLLYGGGLAEKYGSEIQNLMNSMSEDGKEFIVQIIGRVIPLDLSKMTADQIINYYAAYITETIKLAAPGLLISIGALNTYVGLLSGKKIRSARHAEGASSAALSACRMPPRIIVGFIVFAILGFILSKTNGTAGDVILTTVLLTISFAAEVQFFASLTDRLSKFPFGKVRKVLFGILFTLLFLQAIPFYGILSMLFGSKGLVTTWIINRRNNRNDE